MSNEDINILGEEEFPDCAGKSVSESVPEVYQWAVANVNRHIQWYRDSQGHVSQYAKGIRISAVVLLGVGGIFPLLETLSSVNSLVPALGKWGYVVLALAGVLLGIDNYCGFSRTWIRHVNTWMSLDKLRDEFHFDWVNLVTGTPPDYSIQLKRIKDYVLAVDEIVKNETAQWAADFQNSMTQLDTAVKAASTAAKPGSLNVKVTDTTGLKNIKVIVGDTQRDLDGASETLFNVMPPNNYLVEVQGNDVNGNIVRQKIPVVVQPATMATAKVSLGKP